MRRRFGWSRLAFIALLAHCCGGCAGYRTLRQDAQAARQQVDSLRLEVREIRHALDRQFELVRLVRADQQVRFDGLDRTTEALVGEALRSQDRLTNLDRNTQQLRRGWEERARADSLSDASRQAEAQSLFDIALSDFRAGRRAAALNGFVDLVRRFPQSSLADAASYWVAECHYAQKEYAQAHEGYTEYLRGYPEGQHVCGALLKMGMIYERQQKMDARDKVWTTVVQRCAGADEAAVAKARLQGK
jgi:TolA-binding protein